MTSIVSFGGGVNSTALLIGLRERDEIPDAILFADTGGEKPATYEHVERVDEWCKASGMPPITRVSYSTSAHDSLESECHANETLPSKAFGFGGCSQKWKRYPMDRWVDNYMETNRAWECIYTRKGALGAFVPQVIRLIGIHAGETRRGKIPDDLKFTYRFSLREWNWSQAECEAACLRILGYVPDKSECFYCPSMKKREVIQLSISHPDLFERAVAMERQAVESGNLMTVKGLGRHWTWEGLVAADERQQRLFEDNQAPLCDVCMDS